MSRYDELLGLKVRCRARSWVVFVIGMSPIATLLCWNADAAVDHGAWWNAMLSGVLLVVYAERMVLVSERIGWRPYRRAVTRRPMQTTAAAITRAADVVAKGWSAPGIERDRELR